MRRTGATGRRGAAFLLTAALAFAGLSVPTGAGAAPRATPADAYVWGLPLVVSMRELQTFASAIGVNHLFWQNRLSMASNRIVVAPNVDTLYSVAVLDLRAGPVTLTVPKIADRYYTYEFLNAYTEAFAYVGTRATHGAAGTWVVVPPKWKGALPAGAHVIRSATPLVFVLGRFLVDAQFTEADVAALHGRITLRPLRAGSTPSLGTPKGIPSAAASAGASFYDELGDALAVNPPATKADRAELAKFSSLGIGPGRHPTENASPKQLAALDRGVQTGGERVQRGIRPSDTRNGWLTRVNVGRYGADFATRAAVAQSVWGANVPEESAYALSTAAADGKLYDGTKTYVLHFDDARKIPAKAFWSLTLYGPDQFLVENPQHVYALGDRTPTLQYGAGHALDLYIGHDPPASHERNWLPAPPGRFSLLLRLYLPTKALLDGSFHLPPVREVS